MIRTQFKFIYFRLFIKKIYILNLSLDTGLLSLQLCYLFYFFVGLSWFYILCSGLVEWTWIDFFKKILLLDIKLLNFELCDFGAFFSMG